MFRDWQISRIKKRMTKTQVCKNKDCRHLKYDHSQTKKNKKVVGRGKCEWHFCKCLKFQPGEIISVHKMTLF